MSEQNEAGANMTDAIPTSDTDEIPERDRDLIVPDDDARYLLYIDNRFVAEAAPSPVWSEIYQSLIKLYGEDRVQYRFIPRRQSVMLQGIIATMTPAYAAWVTRNSKVVRRSLRSELELGDLATDDLSEEQVDQIVDRLMSRFHIMEKEDEQ